MPSAEFLFHGPAIVLLFNTPLVFGLLCFMLSWALPRRWVQLSGSAGRTRRLRLIGVFGPVAILAACLVQSIVLNVLPYTIGGVDPIYFDPAWLPRSVLLLTTALVVLAAGLTLGRRDSTSDATVAPRRAWYRYAPHPALWLGGTASALIAITGIWQASISGNPRMLPDFASGELRDTHGGAGAPDSAFGWSNNGPVLLALVALISVLVWAFSADANRATETSESRTAAARLLSWIGLGGLLMGLGSSWANAWIPAEWILRFELPDGSYGDFLGSPYDGLISLLHPAAWALTSVSFGLLLRVAVDTLRAARALHRADQTSSTTVRLADTEVSR